MAVKVDMNPERWDLITEIFEAARARSLCEQERFLFEACRNDELLLKEVTSLLKAHDMAEGFMQTSIAESAVALLCRTSSNSEEQRTQLPAGKSLLHYQIHEKLGEGGMGVVYRALDLHLDRFVAIKVLAPRRVIDSELRRRFLREARAASALNHPNIITIHDLAAIEDIDFIVMEYVAGQALDQLLASRKLPIGEVVRYGTQIADALATAHAAGIVHRDLKPANIMIGANGLVKVLDFGVAKLMEGIEALPDSAVLPAFGDSTSVTLDGVLVGTDAYMSPEQVQRAPTDARSDVFSLGSLLYEMVSGRKAFPKAARTEVLAAVAKHQPQPLREIVEELSPALESLIFRALEKNPAHRWQSMRELKSALQELAVEETREEGFQAKGSVRSKVETTIRWKPIAKHPFAILVAVAIVLLSGASYWLGFRTPIDAVVGSRVLPFTTYPGSEGDPSFSPDGDRVAFVWGGPKNENRDIYVKQVGTESLRRMTTDPRRDFSPSWSPNGESIAFVRDLNAGQSAVMMISVNEGHERQVAVFRSEHVPLESRWICWHPDGKWLAVAGDQESAGLPAAIYLLSTETGEWKRLTSPPGSTSLPDLGDTNPAFSADGRSLAFVRFLTGMVSELFVLPLDDLSPEIQPRQLTFSEKSTVTPVWMPDGKRLLFASGSHFNSASLWQISVASAAKPQPIPVSGDGLVADPAISITTRRLIYKTRSTDLNIWRNQIRHDNERPVAPVQLMASSRLQHGAKYSPDGHTVAFLSYFSGNAEIWLCNDDGSDPQQLTHLDGPMPNLSHWSPDGQQVLFSLSSKGKWNLHVFEVQSRQIRQLVASPFNDLGPTYSRDGRWLYFASDRSGEFQVWKMPAEGGAAVQLTQNGGDAPSESEDGKELFYLKARGEGISDLWKLPTDGGAETRVLEGVLYTNYYLKERGIYYASQPNFPETKFAFFEFSTGKSKTLATVQRYVGYGFTVSPDENWILSAQSSGTRGTSDLVLVENFR